MERRNFLERGVRWLMAGSMVGLSGLLLFQRKIGDPSDCFINPYCQRCRQNASCGIVAKATEKNNEEGERK